MSELKCICPVVEIKTTDNAHVSDVQAKAIANELRATVALTTPDRYSVSYGKHRSDCPCGPREDAK